MSTPLVNYKLPGGALLVDERHDLDAVKYRLQTLIERCEDEGAYTRGNTAWLALQAIEQLQAKVPA